jgi:hypothetical protein
MNQTTTPNVPSWISDPTQALAGQIGALGDASQYAPTASPLQKQAWDAASTLQNPNYSAATDVLNGIGSFTPSNVTADQVQGQSLLTGLSDYYNPFKDQVLNPVMNDFDFQAGQTRAQQAAQAAAGKAFQGSRYGIQEAATEDALARGRATTEGGLLNQMYTSATGLSADDAARRQAAMTSNQSADLQAAIANQSAAQAAASLNNSTALSKAQQLAAITGAQGADARQNLALQDQLGGEATNEQQLEQQYPLTFLAQKSGLLSGLNPGLYTGSSTSGTGTSSSNSTQTVSDPMGTFANLLGAASSFVNPAAGLFKGFQAASGIGNALAGGAGSGIGGALGSALAGAIR